MLKRGIKKFNHISFAPLSTFLLNRVHKLPFVLLLLFRVHCFLHAPLVRVECKHDSRSIRVPVNAFSSEGNLKWKMQNQETLFRSIPVSTLSQPFPRVARIHRAAKWYPTTASRWIVPSFSSLSFPFFTVYISRFYGYEDASQFAWKFLEQSWEFILIIAAWNSRQRFNCDSRNYFLIMELQLIVE